MTATAARAQGALAIAALVAAVAVTVVLVATPVSSRPAPRSTAAATTLPSLSATVTCVVCGEPAATPAPGAPALVISMSARRAAA